MPTVGDLAATSPLVTGIAGTQKPLLGGNFGLVMNVTIMSIFVHGCGSHHFPRVLRERRSGAGRNGKRREPGASGLGAAFPAASRGGQPTRARLGIRTD